MKKKDPVEAAIESAIKHYSGELDTALENDPPRDSDKDMKAILWVIQNEGGEDGLATEIIWSAMLRLKDNPTCHIEDAIEYGISEWLK